MTWTQTLPRAAPSLGGAAPAQTSAANRARLSTELGARILLPPQPFTAAAQRLLQGRVSQRILGCDASLAPAPSSRHRQPQLQLCNLTIPLQPCPAAGASNPGADGSPEKSHGIWLFQAILFPNLEQKEIQSVKSNSSWA